MRGKTDPYTTVIFYNKGADEDMEWAIAYQKIYGTPSGGPGVWINELTTVPMNQALH